MTIWEKVCDANILVNVRECQADNLRFLFATERTGVSHAGCRVCAFGRPETALVGKTGRVPLHCASFGGWDPQNSPERF